MSLCQSDLKKLKEHIPTSVSPIVYGGILFIWGGLGCFGHVPVVCWSFPISGGALQCAAGIGKARAIVLNCTWAAQDRT